MSNENMNPQNNQQPQQPQYQQPQQPQQPQYQQPQQPQYQQPQYQQPQQPQYQQPMYQQPMYQKPARNPMDGRAFSITSLVVGCCSIALCWTGLFNFILLACGIVAIIMGNKGRQMSIAAYGKASGLATAGFVLGIIGTAITGVGALSCLACYGCTACALNETANAFSDLESLF